MPRNDQQLRDAGFKIHARPPRLEARWRRGRLIFTESDAHKIAERELQQKIELLQEKYSA
jgi:hypothetical protein